MVRGANKDAAEQGPEQNPRAQSAITRRQSPAEATSEVNRFAHIELPSRYQLKQELGRGGMGSVFRAYDRTAGHDIALKLLHGFSAVDRLRLKKEFRALSNIVHPNLVDLYELVIDDRSCFFTMELVNGEDFATYVAGLKSKQPNDWNLRFRDIARQLALALHSLHEDHKLHRDVKPSNVLVTDAGRVVLLDFGLTSSSVPGHGAEELGGTLQYMSPEQLWGDPMTPASDWYSFGVTLYEAITGTPPNRATAATAVEPESLRAQGFDLDEDLDQLVLGLLRAEPDARPSAAEILPCLGSGVRAEYSRNSFVPEHESPELLGREAPLDCLRTAFAEVAESGTRIVQLYGPSGIGKSSLVQSFFSELASRPHTLLLKSRCHPQEALVFNALDGFIDELSEELSGCLDADERWLPESQRAALALVFPVLARALEAEAPSRTFGVDEREKRHLAFSAIRELLKRIAKRWSIVLWLDDVQWGDEDSGMLLRDLLRGRDRPQLLLILSYRQEDENESPCLKALQDEPDFETSNIRIQLEPLDDELSTELLRKLVGPGRQADSETLANLIRSAGGSPFLLSELARYVAASAADEQAPAHVGLDEMLRRRTQNLSTDSQTLLEVLAVAGAPLEQQTTLMAANLDPTERGLITHLERLSILRTIDVKSHRLEFYHHKLQEEVRRQINPANQAKHHQAIANAMLSTSPPNPLGALEHFDAAGDESSVRRYVVTAANHALKVLAFDRAARLFRRAIELQPGEITIHELYRRLGLALGSAGRGKEAGQAFLDAAERLKAEEPDSDEELVQLRQRAAEQFIQTGHFEQGLAAIRAVLEELAVPFPKARKEALRKAGMLRMLSLAKKLDGRVKNELPKETELQRFDALWSVNARLAMVDYALCSYATAKCAADALVLGEASRLSGALSMEAAYCATLPYPMFQRRALKLIKTAQQIADKAEGVTYDKTLALAMRGVVSFYQGNFRSTVNDVDSAHKQLRSILPGRHWVDTQWRMWSMLGLALSGELRELIARVQATAEEAELREDRYLEQNVRLGATTIAWLALDLPEETIERADLALSWAPSDYTIQHYQHFVTTVDADLYRGDALSAWRRAVATWPAHRGEFFLMLTFVRDDLLRARAKSAIAAAIALKKTRIERTEDGLLPSKLLKIASSSAKQMARHGLDCGRGWAHLVWAACASLQGSPVDSVIHLKEAVDAFNVAEMHSYREAARFGLGVLNEEPDLVAEAQRWFESQGVKNPRRLITMMAPGVLDDRAHWLSYDLK